MFTHTDEVKVLRDPVHGYIHVDEEVIWNLINSSWMQRLRRIRQLGGAYMVYHCAEHTRFSHSLGVYEIVRRMCEEVPDLRNTLSQQEKITVQAAALLHDLGHGPYSHAFESISHTSHETVTTRIIEHDPEIKVILENGYKGMAKAVADVIKHKHTNPILSQLISSQLDADRMDYLLRDAYFTGTTYGTFDLERILRTMRVKDDRLVIKASGVYAVENYIMARYHMYWQVYYHPTARSYEAILRALFERLMDSDIVEDKYVLPLFQPLRHGEKLTNEEYFQLDEYACAYGFELLTQCNDPILKDLASRLLHRRLFNDIPYQEEMLSYYAQKMEDEGINAKYYLLSDEVMQRPYVPYNGEAGSIFVLMEDGSIRELANASNIVYSLIHGPAKDEKKIFLPNEVID